MKPLLTIVLLAAFLAPTAAFAQTASNAENKAAAAIRHQFKRFAHAIEQGDAVTLANIYAKNAILLLPNSKPIKGRAQLRSLFAGEFKAIKMVISRSNMTIMSMRLSSMAIGHIDGARQHKRPCF